MKSGFSCFSKIVNAAIASLSVATLLTACAPEPTAREFKRANRDFGPTRTDGELEMPEVRVGQVPSAASIRWNGDIDAASWLRTSDDLMWLARTNNRVELADLASRMRDAVSANKVSWATTVASSAYASAAVGETKQSTSTAVARGVAMLKAQEPLIENLLKERNARMRWPTSRTSVVSVVEQIDAFITAFGRDIEASNVDKAVRRRILDELRITFAPKLKRVRQGATAAYQEHKIYDFVAKIRKVLKDEGLNLGEKSQARLELAERLPRDVEKIEDAKSALSVLVDFWRASSGQTRESKFKVMAPELYDFFHGQSEDDLECVRTGCGLITTIKRYFFILPEIEDYGIPRLQKKLAEAAEEAIRGEIEEEAVKFLPTLHLEVQKQIMGEISRQRDHIANISRDYDDYLRIVLNRMAAAKFGLEATDTIESVEPNRIRVDLDFGRTGRAGPVQVARLSRDGFQTGAEVIGAGLAAAIEMHDSMFDAVAAKRGLHGVRAGQNQAKLFFEQLSKVLMIGGFKTENGKPFEAFAVAVKPGASMREIERFNLRSMISSPTTYAVPEVISLEKPGRGDVVVASEIVATAKAGISIQVAGQAELVRGLSRVARSLKDWQETSFDRVLGGINVADFVADLPREALDQPLFPKDLFYAAAVGNAGAILQNISKDLSSVALISPSGKMHWANEKDSAADPSQRAIVATMFDIENGRRVLDAKSVDVARFVSAVAEFLKATDGIERTRAEVLLKADTHGNRPLDEILAARTDLKMLVMALANFLSSEALDSRGLVRPTFRRTPKNQVVGMMGEPRLLDQAVVIRALLDASEVISAKVYQVAAVDLLSATNASFFDSGVGFYVENMAAKEMPNLETTMALLVAGERVAAFQTPIRTTQWKNMSRPWINALRDAADSLP